MKYEDVAVESNLGREYLCDMSIDDWSLGEKVLKVRAFEDYFVMTDDCSEDGWFRYYKPSWIKNVIKDVTPLLQLELL